MPKIFYEGKVFKIGNNAWNPDDKPIVKFSQNISGSWDDFGFGDVRPIDIKRTKKYPLIRRIKARLKLLWWKVKY